MTVTGIVKDARYKGHRMEENHLESPRRLDVLYAMLEEPDIQGRFREIPARPATREELLLVHSPKYLDRLEATRDAACTVLDPDTRTCPESYGAALLAAGGLCEAVRHVVNGDVTNAFALVRPPGHHAERDCAKGFCLCNNVAVGARYAQNALGLDRILVVDWDLHHGNGTQHLFEDDPTVLYLSMHQYPHYPGSGRFGQAGRGKGMGFTINIPLQAGCGDGEYVLLLERILKPVALEFQPDIVLVSAGFDIHEMDPLGGMTVTTGGFAAMARSVMTLAEACCRGRLVLTLEGGYHLDALRASVKAVLRETAGLTTTDPADFMEKAERRKAGRIMKRVLKVHAPYWSRLRDASIGLHGKMGFRIHRRLTQ